MSVVDLGCGTGLLGEGTAVVVTGVDNSPAMLRRARATGRIDRAVSAPADATGLESGAYDAVIVANLLHLHPDPAAVVGEARRLCRTGGVVFFSWPAEGIDIDRLYRLERAAGRGRASAAVARALRHVVGVAAYASGVRRGGDRLLVDLVDAAFGGATDHRRVAGCQNVLVARRQ